MFFIRDWMLGMDANNDNEKLSFITLAAATANVVRYLQPDEKKNDGAASDGNGSGREKEKCEAHEKYVDQRLRDLAAFEREVSGIKPRRRK